MQIGPDDRRKTPRENVLRGPLIFGNAEQIAEVRRLEREAEARAAGLEPEKKLCVECLGEGMVTCPACEGTGNE